MKCLWSFLPCLHLEVFRCLNAGGHHALKYFRCTSPHFNTLHYVSLLSDHPPIPTEQTLWNKIHRSTQSSVQYLNWILQIFARSEPVQMTKSYFPSSFWVLVGEELKEGWRWCIPRRVWISKRGTGYKCISAAHTYLSSAGSVSERYQAWLCISRSCISAPSTAIAPGRDQTPQP